MYLFFGQFWTVMVAASFFTYLIYKIINSIKLKMDRKVRVRTLI